MLSAMNGKKEMTDPSRLADIIPQHKKGWVWVKVRSTVAFYPLLSEVVEI